MKQRQLEMTVTSILAGLLAMSLMACGGSPVVKRAPRNAAVDRLSPSQAQPEEPKVKREAADLFAEGVAL